MEEGLSLRAARPGHLPPSLPSPPPADLVGTPDSDFHLSTLCHFFSCALPPRPTPYDCELEASVSTFLGQFFALIPNLASVFTSDNNLSQGTAISLPPHSRPGFRETQRVMAVSHWLMLGQWLSFPVASRKLYKGTPSAQSSLASVGGGSL